MIIRKLSDYKESKVLFSNTGVSYYGTDIFLVQASGVMLDLQTLELDPDTVAIIDSVDALYVRHGCRDTKEYVRKKQNNNVMFSPKRQRNMIRVTTEGMRCYNNNGDSIHLHDDISGAVSVLLQPILGRQGIIWNCRQLKLKLTEVRDMDTNTDTDIELPLDMECLLDNELKPVNRKNRDGIENKSKKICN